MDRTYSTTIGEFGKEVIQIGRVGENQFRSVAVDCAEWFEDYPNGSLVLVYVAPNGAAYMPANVTTSGTTLTWIIEAVDLQTKGVGAAQITLYDGDTVARSSIAPVNICESIEIGPEPTPVTPDWIQKVLALLAPIYAELAQKLNITGGTLTGPLTIDYDGAGNALTIKRTLGNMLVLVQDEDDPLKRIKFGILSGNVLELSNGNNDEVTLVGLAAPGTDPSAATNKEYVDDGLAAKIDKNNGTATGTLNVANEEIGGRLVVINAAGNGGMFRGYTASSTQGIMLRVLESGDDPSSSSAGTEIINFRKTSVLFTVPIYMSNARIRNLAAPSSNSDAANMKYVNDQRDAAMSYADTVAAGKVTNNGSNGNVIVYPSAENTIAEIINDSGGNSFFRVNRGALGVPATAEMNSGSGVISANSCRLGSVADPTNAQDAATKAYVDAQIQAIRTELGI